MALPGADEIIVQLLPELREGDVVAIMSNGGFGGIHEKLLAALEDPAITSFTCISAQIFSLWLHHEHRQR